MNAYDFAVEAFREDVERSLPAGTPKEEVDEVLEDLAQQFVESFQYCRLHRRPFESLDRHEDSWRGTGDLAQAIHDAREIVGVPDPSEDEDE